VFYIKRGKYMSSKGSLLVSHIFSYS